MSESTYKFGSTHVDFTPNDDKKLQEAWQLIQEDELTEDGIEQDIHCTVRYGIKNEDCTELCNEIEKKYPNQFSITVDGIGLFENDTDCVHYTVEQNSNLTNLRGLVEEVADCAPSDYGDYIPHITIAYLVKGTGKAAQKRLQEGLAFPFEVLCDTFVFSARDKSRHKIPLKDSKQIAESEIKGLVYGRIRSRDSENNRG